ncbi:J domain-containing protein required for chloroplast accumulation response 1-like [Nymphaea colorata]|nr:J domain-containing protein required for chloroplast accumulation response 1-like [Nymphaea colorata]
MEKVSYPEHVHLGYNSRKLFGIKSASAISSPKPPGRIFDPVPSPSLQPEFDFADVFGGPPRAAAAKEAPRLNIEESRRNLQEKPVFGEGSPTRSRLLSEDFFADIYGGSNLTANRRRPEKVAFYSMPVSRILSPTCSSPPRMPPLSPGPALPSRMSQYAEPGKEAQSPASASLICPNPSRYNDKLSNANGVLHSPVLSVSSPREQAYGYDINTRLPVPPVQRQAVLINYSQPSSRQSMSPHQRTAERQSKLTESIRRNPEGEVKVEPVSTTHGSQNLHSSSQFHFSIHKWAGKGAAFFMPVKRRDEIKQDLKEEKINRQQKMSPHDDAKQSVAPTSNSGPFQAHISSPRDLYPSRKEYHEQQGNRFFHGDSCNLSSQDILTSAGNFYPDLKEESGSQAGPLSSLLKNDKEISVKSQAGHLAKLLKNDKEISGKTCSVDQKEDVVRDSIRTSNVYDRQEEASGCSRLDNAEAARPCLKTAEPNSDASLLENRTRGKVKEFIKMFNQEAPQKFTFKGEKPSRKGVESSNAEAEPRASGGTHIASKHTSPEPEHEEVDNFDLQFTVHEIHDPSPESNDNFQSCAQESPQVVHDLAGRSLDNLGRQLADEKKSSIAQPQDELQNLDAKIKKWAHGKEGNIRSLLSTLQYILWPESGWKPVPLVDIVEGTAVRRAYQKAMLCLHPDKLQQKGGTIPQKYTAEQIFDILQDAWTNFNNVASF